MTTKQCALRSKDAVQVVWV